MDSFLNIVQSFLSIGSVTILPFFITIIGLIFRMNFWKSLKSGLLVGIGFQGISLVINFLMGTVQPVIDAFSAAGTGMNFPIVDIGWASLSAAAWASPFAAIVLPAGFLLNFILIKAGATKTLNVDVWNYWHFIFSAAIVYYMMIGGGCGTGISIAVAFAVAMLCSYIACWIGDRIAGKWQTQFGLEGTTCTTIYYTATFVPINWLVNKIMDLIPGVDKIDLDAETVQKKLGPIGEPSIFAFLVGILMGIISGQSVTSTLQIGVGVAVAIVLLPKMVAMLMEGMSPLSVAAHQTLSKKLGQDREFYVGMDIALAIGDQTAITASLLMIPITVGIALIFPNNGFFPTATLGALIYITALGSMSSGGKLLRTMIMGIFFVIWHLIALNLLADVCTVVMNNSGVLSVPAGTKTAAFALDSSINLIIGLLGKLFGLA